MSDQLRIRSVNAEHFGGLSKRRLELPDSPLVVVFGPNEAGKSTFSELISWLLVGPASAGDVVRRFASGNEVLKGSLTGTLRGDNFSASAEFKVTPSGGGIGKASIRDYHFGGPLTADQWLDRLGRLDQQAMAGIYRLWGQQLHDGGDADRELRRAGLGVLADSADPRELAKKLEILSKPSARVGPGESSFKSLASDLRAIAGELREAESNVDQYGDVEAAIEDLKSQRLRSEDHRTKLERRRNLLEKVARLDQLRDDQESAEELVRSCAPVAPEWADVVGDMSALQTLVKSSLDTRRLLDDAAAGLRQRLIVVGADSSTSANDVLSDYTISATNSGPIATAVSQVGHTLVALNKCVSKHGSAVADSESAADQLALVLADLDTDADTLRRAKLDEESRVQLGLFSKTYDESVGLSKQAELSLDGARVTIATARAAHDRALHDWQLMGIGSTPEAWLSGASRAESSSFDSRWMWALRAVLVAAGVGSAAAGQWVLTLLAVVALAITWFARSASSPPDHNADLDAAAEGVRTASSALGAAEVDEATEATRLSNCHGRVAGAKAEVAELSERYGVSFPADPHLLSGALADWVSALELLKAAESCQRKLTVAAGELESASDAETDAKSSLDALLTGLGLPAGISHDAASSQADDYIALVESALMVRGCDDNLRDAKSALRRLLQPVVDEVEGWSPEKLMETAESAAVRLRAVDDVKRKFEDATRVLDGSLGTDPEVRRLFDEGVSPEDRGREAAQIEADLESVAIKINGISAKIGLEDQLRKKLRLADRVADLRLSKGSLADSQSEVASELAVNRLAGVILRSVADVYERENQPELVKRTGLLAARVANDWESIKVKATGPDSSELRVQFVDGSDVASLSLSTGARALLYLSLRLAMADDDGEKRRIQLPILCDDPLVHLDDQRALSAMNLLAEAAERRQVVVFTCHGRTIEAAGHVGAEIVQI